jgi:hypothetical protein
MSLFNVDPDMRQLLQGMTEEELDAFAETQDAPEDETGVELYVYVHFLVFAWNGSIQRIQQALLHAEGWAALSSESHAEQARRLDILNQMSAIRSMDPWRNQRLVIIPLIDWNLARLDLKLLCQEPTLYAKSGFLY